MNYIRDMMLLPSPANPSHYYYISRPVEVVQGTVLGRRILYSLVDVEAQGGRGEILEKDVVIVQDTFTTNALHAVRHANGRDWWIIANKRTSNTYCLILLDPSGFHVKFQSIGPVSSWLGDNEMLFSPDGNYFAWKNPRQIGLLLFRFDRCTGELYDPLVLPEPEDSLEITAGAAFSADSRFLYSQTPNVCNQYDLWADDIAASRQVVARWEWEKCYSGPLPAVLSHMQLAPNGEIYAKPPNGQKVMLRIRNPERPGLACNYDLCALSLAYFHNNLPHFPNFRLGPIDGSACDTLGIDNVPLAGWRHDVVGGLQADFTSVSWYEPESWYWDFGDPASGSSNYSTEKHPTHQFSASGTYQVCLTVSNANGSDTKCKNIWVGLSAANQPMDGSRISFYPNPARETLYWQGLPIGQEARVQLWDLHGRLVHEDVSSRAETRLPAGLPSGIYVARLLDAAAGRVLHVGKVAVW